jgi:hypothetical protein
MFYLLIFFKVGCIRPHTSQYIKNENITSGEIQSDRWGAESTKAGGKDRLKPIFEQLEEIQAAHVCRWKT